MPHDLGAEFRALHQRGNPFVLANAWDIGSAKVLAGLGAKAIATSSAAHGFTLGRPDMGQVTRDEALAHACDLAAAVNVPVSGDFENGFGEAPETCAETVRLSGEAGLAGICIEDTALPDVTPYARDLSIERIRAAASAARTLKKDFVLIARADGIMNGQYDIEEALARVRGYEEAGADGIYVPIPKNFDDLARICAAVSVPVNVLAAGPYAKFSLAQYAEIGAARISLGSALARVTHQAIVDVANDFLRTGDFSRLQNAASGDKIDALLMK